MPEDAITLKNEFKSGLSRPWRLPRNMAIAAICTFAGISIGIAIKTFHRGLPYIAADLFIWTMATYNVMQLGADSKRTLSHVNRKLSLREIFLIKNVALFIFALPIDLLLIIIACWWLNDWSSLGLATILAVSVAVIGLGLGNLASVMWVYQPTPLWRSRKDRVKLYDYAMFIAATYITASVSIVLASLPAWLILHFIGTSTYLKIILGLIIVAGWSILLWVLATKYAELYAKKHRIKFINRLSGQQLIIKNRRLKKLLKVS